KEPFLCLDFSKMRLTQKTNCVRISLEGAIRTCAKRGVRRNSCGQVAATLWMRTHRSELGPIFTRFGGSFTSHLLSSGPGFLLYRATTRYEIWATDDLTCLRTIQMSGSKQ